MKPAYFRHEYLARNLEFTLDREPDNTEAGAARSARHQDPVAASHDARREKRINTFFRLQHPE